MRTRLASRLMTRLALALSLAVPAAALAATGASAADGNATVTVVHGIPDTPVDVYVDGSKALSDFTFKTVTDPISLPAGAHAIAVRKAGDPKSAAPILTANPSLPAGANATIVANLTADGKPTLTPFVNPTSSVPDGMARARGPAHRRCPRRGRARRRQAGDHLADQPEREDADGPGRVPVRVGRRGRHHHAGDRPGPADLASGSTTIVYAVGSLADKNLTAVAQTYSGSGRPPARSTPAPAAWPLTPAASAWAPAWPPSPAPRSVLGFGLSLRRSGASQR